LPWFDKTKVTINKEKLLARDFHHKSYKHIVFRDIILEERKVTCVSEEKLLGSVARSQFKLGLSYRKFNNNNNNNNNNNIYIYIDEILLYTKMYLIRFKNNSVFHPYDTWNKSDLFNFKS
jgi:hypothetical protein